ncbi:MAG: GNAT family N-acetyltransferase [Actinomycetales bacterium]|nr:GNAT family N-acetyltransferase [Actinomycetales bacterium]
MTPASGSRGAAKREELAGRLAERLVPLVEQLPFPPVAEAFAQQASEPTEPPMQVILAAAREILSTPAAAWSREEVWALALADGDHDLHAAVEQRIAQRWGAVVAVMRQLRGAGAVDATVDDAAAALHAMAVGLGLSILLRVSPGLGDAGSWQGLAARLVESLAAANPEVEPAAGEMRTWRGRVTIPGQPTALARLLRVLSLLDVSVVSLFTIRQRPGEHLVEMIMQAPVAVERATIAQAMASVSDEGTGQGAIVARGVSQDTEDIATRVLLRCADLVRDPDAAPQAAADLVLADAWEVTDAATGADASATVLRLQWTFDRHVVLRRRTPFTRTEAERASALLRLVAALAELRTPGAGYGWAERLADGSDVWVRLARPHDSAAVAAMHERCSQQSRYQRYFTPMDTWREENLRRISGGHRGATLVATVGESDVVALGNVFPAGDPQGSAAEIAVIVDDGWQRRGLGRAMLQHLIDVAGQLGFSSVRAYVLAENTGMLRLMASLDLDWAHRVDHDFGASVVCLEAELPVTAP